MMTCQGNVATGKGRRYFNRSLPASVSARRERERRERGGQSRQERYAASKWGAAPAAAALPPPPTHWRVEGRCRSADPTDPALPLKLILNVM